MDKAPSDTVATLKRYNSRNGGFGLDIKESLWLGDSVKSDDSARPR